MGRRGSWASRHCPTPPARCSRPPPRAVKVTENMDAHAGCQRLAWSERRLGLGEPGKFEFLLGVCRVLAIVPLHLAKERTEARPEGSGGFVGEFLAVE